MKKLTIFFGLLISLGVKSQVCDPIDNLAVVTPVGKTTASFSYDHATTSPRDYQWGVYTVPGLVFVTGGTTTNNFLTVTGLTASTAYRLRIKHVCSVSSESTTDSVNFTTTSSEIVYTPMTAAGYKFKYLAGDSGFTVPRLASPSLGRGLTAGGSIVFNTTDKLFYGYDGTAWNPLATDSAGVMSAINLKVDSVTVTGDSLFYWINGVSRGYTVTALAPNGTNGLTKVSNDIKLGGTLIEDTDIDGDDFDFTLSNANLISLDADSVGITLATGIKIGRYLPNMYSTGSGSVSSGYAPFGLIKATGDGSYARGRVFNNANSSRGLIEATGMASTSSGYSQYHGKISASGVASFAGGIANDSSGASDQSTISATNNASFTWGVAAQNGRLTAAGSDANTTWGLAQGGTIRTNGSASWAWGRSNASSLIASDGLSSFAGGYATGGDSVFTNGSVSWLFGQNLFNTGHFSMLWGSGLRNSADNQFKVGWGSDLLTVDGDGDVVTVGGELTVTSSALIQSDLTVDGSLDAGGDHVNLSSGTELGLGASGAGTSGQIAKSNGTGASPSWVDPSSLGLGTVTNVSALTLGTAGTDLSSSVANPTTTPVITLNVPTASASNRGALSSTDWSTFNNKFTLPSLTSGSVLFSNGTTISQNNANFFWDNSNVRLGIGKNNPALALDIAGEIKLTGTYPYYSIYPSGWSGGYMAFQAGVDANASTTGDFAVFGYSAGKGFSIAEAGSSKLVLNTGGNLGIGTITTSARVHAISTTEQLRIGYDASNYFSTTVGSTGGITFNAVGSGAGFTYSDDTRFNTAVGINTDADVTATYKLSILGDQFLEGNLWLHNGSVVGRLSQNANNDIESSRNLIAPRLLLGSTADHPETSPLRIIGVVEYADNAAAVTAGLTAGDVYRTGDVLKIVH